MTGAKIAGNEILLASTCGTLQTLPTCVAWQDVACLRWSSNYVDGGGEEEVTLRAAFNQVTLRPRHVVDVSQCDLDPGPGLHSLIKLGYS